MKWSAFIAGGIAGVAAAALLHARRPESMQRLSQGAGRVWRQAKSRGVERAVRAGLATIEHSAKDVRKMAGEESAKAWQRIGELVRSDPHIMREADKILNENGISRPH
ncbi:hypothetical protein IDH44_08320 [Paenibacillus sp. IB182496]|uniref:YtxH domain-containing protein n=1 Tax=Paenibacillus sabuli TaxID=2772509 RepID=A0A927BTE4_9BACL|nr:hypothetical protein [Paenibacillus sabuli]MBD2845194.1 hypothetical protein [Paenibacillus sabuli]